VIRYSNRDKFHGPSLSHTGFLVVFILTRNCWSVYKMIASVGFLYTSALVCRAEGWIANSQILRIGDFEFYVSDFARR